MCPTYRRAAGAQPDGDLTPRQAFLAQVPYLIAGEDKAGPADRSPRSGSVLPCAVQPGARAFAYPDTLLFGDGGKDRDNGIPEYAS